MDIHSQIGIGAEDRKFGQLGDGDWKASALLSRNRGRVRLGMLLQCVMKKDMLVAERLEAILTLIRTLVEVRALHMA